MIEVTRSHNQPHTKTLSACLNSVTSPETITGNWGATILGIWDGADCLLHLTGGAASYASELANF